MGRPTKQGIDYFNLDCSNDLKLELFISDAKIEGFGILIALWQMIYRDEGYYIKYSDDLALILRKYTLAETETIVSVIQKSIKRSLFDKSLYEKYQILTSSGIQKRYLIAAKKKKRVVVDKKYLLINVSDYGNIVYGSQNSIDSYENATKEEEEEEEEVKEDTSPQKSGEAFSLKKYNTDFPHLDEKIKRLFKNILIVCNKISSLPRSRTQKSWKPRQWVQLKINEQKHPEAILYTLNALCKGWNNAPRPWGFCEKIIERENGNFNEAESTATHQKFKNIEIPELIELSSGILKEIPK
jgi:hypothetical protein